jgi:hypothetical protein
MAKPPRDDSDDLPRLKTGCKNFNFFRIKAIITPQYVIAFQLFRHGSGCTEGTINPISSLQLSTVWCFDHQLIRFTIEHFYKASPILD